MKLNDNDLKKAGITSINTKNEKYRQTLKELKTLSFTNKPQTTKFNKKQFNRASLNITTTHQEGNDFFQFLNTSKPCDIG